MPASDEIKNKIRLAASELAVAGSNEATTRLKLIDCIIFELLGWFKDDVKIENAIREDGAIGYYDYVISTGQHSILVEAKKVGADFADAPKGRRAFLRGAWLGRPIGSPIRQARDYGRELGVGFCVATNGLSWVAFPVNRRDQISFEESTCIVFSGVDALLGDIDDFLLCFARENVIAGSLDKALLGSASDQTEPRRLNNIYDRSFSRVNRTSIFPHIER